MKTKSGIKNIIIILLIPVILYMVFLVLRPDAFGKGTTIYNIFQQSIISCIIAWGMSFTMMMNQIDLAVGSEIVFSAIFGAILAGNLGIFGIILGCVIGGLITGVVKIITSRYLKIPTMILTIALTYLFAATGGIITGSASLSIRSEYAILGSAPWNIIIFAIGGTFVYVLHKFSPYGQRVRAVANSESLSRLNGINPDKIKVIALFISSVFAGIAAILKLSHGSSVAPTNGVESISTILEPLMSVFIGMVLSKYINITLGIFIGTILMSIISNGLIAISMPASYNNVVTGSVLLVLMVFISLKSMLDDKKLKVSAAKIRAQNL